MAQVWISLVAHPLLTSACEIFPRTAGRLATSARGGEPGARITKDGLAVEAHHGG